MAGGRPKTNTSMKHLQFRATRKQAARLARLVEARRKVRGKVYTRSDALRQALEAWLDAHGC